MINALFAHVCHQLPARGLAVAGVPLPACARCAVFYLGVAVSFGYFLIPGKRTLFAGWPGKPLAAVAAVAALPNIVNIYLGRAGTWLYLDNYGRFAVALLGGWGAWILLAGAAAALRRGFSAERRLRLAKTAPSLAPLLVPAILLFTPHRLSATLLTAGILIGAVAFYGIISYLPIAFFLHKKRSPRWARVVIAAACGAAALAAMRWGAQLYTGLRAAIPHIKF